MTKSVDRLTGIILYGRWRTIRAAIGNRFIRHTILYNTVIVVTFREAGVKLGDF